MKTTALFAAAVAAIAPWSYGQEESTYSLTDFSIGEIVSGSPVKLDELGGKVVALEFWGLQ
ncbi:MAG TPA: hypothetical protein VMN36_08910 [Verrucomicrobiales bacterium]|nr:hypothetical protein [Verrucomicrobiales bacterium]